MREVTVTSNFFISLREREKEKKIVIIFIIYLLTRKIYGVIKDILYKIKK